MTTYTVKLSKRTALRKLQNESCKIYIEKACSEFVTAPGIKNDCVYVPVEDITVPLEDITKIEMPTSRFTPNKMCMMEIDWENSPASGTQN